MKNLLKFLSEFSPVAVMVASLMLTLTVVSLVILTGYYAWETRALRKIASKAVFAELSPQVFLEISDSITEVNRDEKDKGLYIAVTVDIKNAGKTAASQIQGGYEIFFKEEKKEEGILPLLPVLFPSQNLPVLFKTIFIPLDDKQLDSFTELINNRRNPQNPTVKDSDKIITPVMLNVHFKYIDPAGQSQNYGSRFIYIPVTQKWMYTHEQ